MRTRDQVAAVLGRYDDAAWVALANQGLLRRARKELASAPVSFVAADADAVEVAVGERTVRLPVSGPGEATCSCPSPVICQHILAAGLWLATSQAEDPDALHVDLMSLDAATLTAHAGLPGYRWAHQFLDAADGLPPLASGQYLSITFPAVTFRYLGGGLEGLVPDPRVPNVERYRVAAVLAWQRAHGLHLPPPPAPRASAAGPGETALSLAEGRARLRSTVSAVLLDTVRVGVSHLSPGIHERLVTTSVWAQGAQYHRLALLLRRLADRVELLLARSAAADDLALLDEVAVGYALVAALDAAARQGREPIALMGRARNTYDPVRSLALIGLGGRPWRNGSGYHGVTVVFWSPGQGRMLTWTDARPEDLAGFDPRARWTQAAPWMGLPTPAAAVGKQLTLTNAQVSAAGRISGVETTSAIVEPLDSNDLVDRLPVQTTWPALGAGRIRGLSDPYDPGWVVLRPARSLPARWDAASQTVRWPIADADGGTLVLQLPWSRANAQAIQRVEEVAPRLTPGTVVVARLLDRGLAAEPLSLVVPGQGVDSLHFDPSRSAGRSEFVAQLLASGAPDAEVPSGGTAAVPRQLAGLRSLLQEQAQRGTSGGAFGAQLGQAHTDLRGLGLTVFAEPEPGLDPAESLLRSLYLVQQVERALP